VLSDSIWIVGSTRSGKTDRLLTQLQTWARLLPSQPLPAVKETVKESVRETAKPILRHAPPAPPFLVLAANGDNRLELVDRMESLMGGQCRFDSATPLGFFQDEVNLFWPLLVQQLDLKVQFPLRLRPETEQALATRLWRSQLDSGELHQDGISEYFVVRRTLDLLQLAATSGTPPEEIPLLLKDGLAGSEGSRSEQSQSEDNPGLWEAMGKALLHWRQWCLERGLLTYGIITELYWRYLLPDPTYQHHLSHRYRAVLADDVDEYPAIARSLFDFLLDQGIPGAFTYNPDGAIRLGLGADPQYLLGLATRCESMLLPPAALSLGTIWGAAIGDWINDPVFLPEMPESIQTIQTVSRAQLLRRMAEVIVEAVHSGQVQPQEVAVIGPGVDAIARYTLREILTSRGIAVESLSDQHPLIDSMLVQSLLTLMALVYPGLGRLLDRDAIAQLLVVLSQTREDGQVGLEHSGLEHSGLEQSKIDPVRAGLLTDYCFAPDPDQPRLLPAKTFSRWDRLGYQATQSYGEIVQWIETQQEQQTQRLLPNPVTLLDRAIQRFFFGGSHLPYDQLAALRELMETAQHYWAVEERLRSIEHTEATAAVAVGQFIQLLRNGTITADPYPVRMAGKPSRAVTIATIFQYRSSRRSHHWQFWLDAGSAFWLTGGGPLFGAPLFLHEWSGRSWTAADSLAADQQRLQRQILDLLSRVSDPQGDFQKNRVYLCHSELATNGQEQTGSLLTLVNAASQYAPDFL
jgi:hypothetical protein